MEDNKSKGLGDDIQKVTTALKIDSVAKKIANLMGKEDCGCNQRKEKLNQLFPYNGEKK